MINMKIRLQEVINDNLDARRNLNCTLFQYYMLEENDHSEDVFWKRMNDKLERMTVFAYLYFYIVNIIDNINLGIWN
jgi:hypothetical protein